jgi:hypothetical protein
MAIQVIEHKLCPALPSLAGHQQAAITADTTVNSLPSMFLPRHALALSKDTAAVGSIRIVLHAQKRYSFPVTSKCKMQFESILTSKWLSGGVWMTQCPSSNHRFPQLL